MIIETVHEIEPLTSSEQKKRRRDWSGSIPGYVRLFPGRWLLCSDYRPIANKIYNFKHKKSDVMIMTWPKCGTTWVQEIIWTMRNNPNLDKSDSAAEPLLTRSPCLEFDMFDPTPSSADMAKLNDILLIAFSETCPGKDPNNGIHFQLAQCIPEPRTIKTHLPFPLMPPSMLDTCRVVYVARNPKDVIVSCDHHCRISKRQGYVGSFADFVQYFVNDDLLYGPYWLHVKEAWERRHHPNLLFLFYEDMKADPLKEIKKIDAFIGTRLTEAQMNAIVQYTSFESMKAKNDSPFRSRALRDLEGDVLRRDIVKREGGFFRKGEAGGWKTKITPDLEAKVDGWIRKYLDPIGIRFKYEI